MGRDQDPERRPRSRLWLAGRALLVASLVPLVLGVAVLFLPVDNPGVQACGAPAVFLWEQRPNAAVPVAGLTVEQTQALRAQPTCSSRVDARLRQGFAAVGAFVLLAATGAVLGIVDDRRAYRAAPPFESLLRESPDDA